MKFLRFNSCRFGLLEGEIVREVTDLVLREIAAAPASAWSDPFVAALPRIRAALSETTLAGETLRLSDLRLDVPVASPGKIIGAPVNYQDHIDEMIGQAVAAPHTQRDIAKAGLFLKANSSLAGPAERIVLRFPERRTDHEVELVVVIGRGGSAIPHAEALDHVAGYCLGLDITLRGPEDRSFRKSIDGYSIIGPWLVTSDEFGDPGNVDLELTVNGLPRQRANTADLVFDVARLIEYASSFYTLHPGDLIYTGTPAGVGPIVAGDVIEASGRALGALRIEVVS